MATSVNDAEWLNWIASLMNSSAGAESASPGHSAEFACVLDEQPTHLVPERLRQGLETGESGVELTLNPCFYVPGRGEPPVGLEEGEQLLPNAKNSGLQLVWVQHPAMKRWDPFWVGAELADAIDRVQCDANEIPTLTSHVRSLLKQARILVPSSYAAKCRAAWEYHAENCRRKFHADGYAPISGLIHPFHLGELRRYFRRQIRMGKVRLGDGQSPLRYIAHNDPAAHFFHVQLVNTVADLVGEPVKPSYVYMASYQSGARLEHHTDRAQCEFSLTLCLDYSPEPNGATPWPLYLETSKGTVTVYQALGDGLLYRGRDLPHYRRTLAAGNTSTSIFFHYVAESFDGPLE
jgi:hypothetical protein